MKFSMLAVAATMLAGANGFGVAPSFAIRQSSALKSAAVDVDTKAALATAANEARGLAMDSIAAAHSGHMGLPLGAAEIGATLYGLEMTYNPKDPKWINRDRFILSAGHGSMFLYSWLNLAGFDLPIDELKNFRQYHSMTPGHPEFPNSEHNTPGIESTTGPLGQGVANAVGLAASEKMAAAVYNTDDHKIFDHHIYVLAGDGCFQEGVTSEAACFAAHEKLDNLIVLYDANEVTLDKMAEYTQSEDIIKRYDAYGWETFDIDGHDLDVVQATIAAAKANNNGKPKFIKCNTIIGKGMEETEGTNAAHGEAGVPYVDKAKKNIGLPDGEKCFATQLDNAVHDKVPSAAELIASIPATGVTKPEATRVSGKDAIQQIAKAVPHYISGSADLHGSCRNYIEGGGNFGAGFDKTYAGRNLYFGIREHAMGSILNGFAYHGLFKASGSTFLVFVDYLRPTVRVASLAELGAVSYILTHDSIGVGEDGPTHQPVETVSGLRVIPNLDVYRPADAEETVAAFVHSVTRKSGPTALIFSRQNVDQNADLDYMARREGALKGGYIAKKESADLDVIIIATGSEVQHALKVAKDLPGARVVSMPCTSVFDDQSAEYKESVLPSSCTKRVAMEAGVSDIWYKYASKVIGVDRFGFSAPGDIVMAELGMTADNLAKEIAAMN
ncbi:Transketolase [Fragilaria crotonensis]|nr:Transketolase [Fragilaria crotonensis]